MFRISVSRTLMLSRIPSAAPAGIIRPTSRFISLEGEPIFSASLNPWTIREAAARAAATAPPMAPMIPLATPAMMLAPADTSQLPAPAKAPVTADLTDDRALRIRPGRLLMTLMAPDTRLED
jgi:hypothetical protein